MDNTTLHDSPILVQSFNPFTITANKEDPSHSKAIHLEKSPEMRRDKAIIELQEQVRRLKRDLEQVRGSIPI